jgi:hypothetical protein
MNTVTTLHNGKSKEVKNLGWFLRHSKYVTFIQFKKIAGMRYDGILIVTFSIGSNVPTHEYRSEFGSFELLKDLIQRSQWLRGMDIVES